MSILEFHEIERNLNIYDNIAISYCLILNRLRTIPLPFAKNKEIKKKMKSSKTIENSSLYLWTINPLILLILLIL